MILKGVKMGFLVALLMGAGYFCGTVFMQFGQAYETILSPSSDLMYLLLWLLLALAGVAVTGGLVSALVRPVWAAMVGFALSGLTMLLGWELTTVNGILVLVYVLAGSLYAVAVASALVQRIKFSVEPVTARQGTLLMAVILVACGSLYADAAAHVEREGFAIPRPLVEVFMQQMERQIEAQVPEQERQQVVTQFRQEFQRTLDEFYESTMKPYERFIPLAIAAGMFMSLVTISRLLVWVPALVLNFIFALLAALGITKTVAETRTVQRTVIS